MRPLCILFPKMCTYNSFNKKNNCMYFMIKEGNFREI